MVLDLCVGFDGFELLFRVLWVSFFGLGIYGREFLFWF